MQPEVVASGKGFLEYGFGMLKTEGPGTFYRGFLMNWARCVLRLLVLRCALNLEEERMNEAFIIDPRCIRPSRSLMLSPPISSFIISLFHSSPVSVSHFPHSRPSLCISYFSFIYKSRWLSYMFHRLSAFNVALWLSFERIKMIVGHQQGHKFKRLRRQTTG